MEIEKIKFSIVKIIKVDLFQELFFSAIGCVFFCLLFMVFPKRFWDYPYLESICAVLVLSFFLAFIFLNQKNSKYKFFNTNHKRNIILFSIFFFSTMCFLFFNTNFAINGIQGDNFYRTAYVNRMAYSGYPQDFSYKNLSAFIGPVYWYFLALFARIFQIKPYRMLKIGMLFMYYFLPIIVYESWKRIYEKRVSFIITVISLIFLMDPYSPDHLIGVLLIIPYIMYYFENCKKLRFKLRNYINSGIIGSLLFCSYFLYFLIIPILLLIELIQNKDNFKNTFKNALFHLISLSIFSSWFWVPILRDILLYGFESHQNNYFGEGNIRIPLQYYFQISMLGFILFIGFIFLIFKYKKSTDFRFLGNFFLSIHIIFIIGFIAILFKFPIMHVRFLNISHSVLIISASLFFIKIVNYVNKENFLKKYKLNFNFGLIETYVIIGIVFSSSYFTIRDTYSCEPYQTALDDDVRYDLIDVVKKLDDYEDKIFLTNYIYIADFLPVYYFLLPNPYYAHPSALYNERVKFLIKLSECESSNEFHEKIINCEFGPIDYFWLETDNSSNFIFSIAIEEFPEGRDYYDIKFENILFENENNFKKIEIDDEIIYKTKY